MTTSVIVALRGRGEASLVQAIEAYEGLVVARRCADLAEAIAASTAGLGEVLVVSDQPRLDRSIVKSLRRKKVTLIGVPTSEEEKKRLLALGVGSVAPVGAEAADVVATIVESIADPIEVNAAPAAAPEEGAIVAVWGPTGAPGRTTVAVNLASELSPSTSVLLVDADTYGGAVSQALGMLDEAPGVAAVARVALRGGEIADAIHRYAIEVRPGLAVMGGVSQPNRWREIPSAAVEVMLHTFRTEAAITVVDCGFGIEGGDSPSSGPGRDDATRAILEGADLVVVVGSADPLGIQRLVRALGDLSDGFPGTRTVVVANRVRSSVCGSRPAQAVADVLARFASVSEVWMIPDDPKACDAATLAGQTLVERAPRSSVRRAIQAVAQHVGELTARERAGLSEAPA